MATSKHFTVTVTPTIPGEHQSASSATYGAGDVLFDWTEFNIPKGAAKLVSVTAVLSGKDGGAQSVQDIEFFFAKTINGVAPTTMGNSNATASAAPIVKNHIIGFTKLESNADYGENSFDFFAVGNTGSGAAGSNIPSIVLEGEPDSGTNVGFDKLYLGAIAATSNISFGTKVLTRGAITADNTTTIPTDLQGSADSDPNAETIFAVGDVIETGTGDTVGTIASISAFDTNHQDIILTANNVEAIADDEELFNVNPIKVILSFER
mgnify:CR=1 FL=1|tara:strand:- start:276 stop:1070 length:795 start_codon:yes stop_codon:yes gene_type:complete